MDLPKCPCDVISIDVEDVIGTHIVDFEGNLVKNVIDSKGNIIETMHLNSEDKNTKDIVQRATQALEMNRGCNLKGSIIVNKINGNFHISSHAFGDAIMLLYSQGKTIDVEHKIKHLSFGTEENISKISSITGGYNLAPLDKTIESSRPQNLGGHIHNTMTTYYLDITPTRYMIGDEEEYSAHEYTYSSQTIATHAMPAVFFKYQLSPIFVNYRVTQVSFLVFFIRC